MAKRKKQGSKRPTATRKPRFKLFGKKNKIDVKALVIVCIFLGIAFMAGKSFFQQDYFKESYEVGRSVISDKSVGKKIEEKAKEKKAKEQKVHEEKIKEDKAEENKINDEKIEETKVKEEKEKPALKKKILPFLIHKKPKAKMAIILDDWGNNYSLLERAIVIKRPLTIAIIPHLRYSRAIAESAFNQGLGVMLHMPMQPFGDNQVLEPHTILTTSSDMEIQIFLNRAIESVPYAEGVNNHMGSAATSDARVMGVVLKELKKRGLFFVDSYVTSQSVAGAVAKKIGNDFTKRDIFIDNKPELTSIKAELLNAKRVALKTGRVVVIGHDKRLTLQAIDEVAKEFEDEGIEFVLVKDLIYRKRS